MELGRPPRALAKVAGLGLLVLPWQLGLLVLAGLGLLVLAGVLAELLLGLLAVVDEQLAEAPDMVR